MKKLCLPLLTALCLLLSGCGTGSAKAALEELSAQLENCTALSFTADVRAEYEHKTARFTLRYQEDRDGGLVTVIAPELIAGVSARIEPGTTKLEYDSVVLDTGSLDNFGLSPLSSMPLLVQSIRTGHPASCRTEGDFTVIELEPDDGLRCTVWFDSAMTPARAELARDGRVILYLEINDWDLT